jgi:triacylglycerol lipase
LHIVGTYAGAPPANLKELLPYADGSVLVGVVGYALNGVIAEYPEFADLIRSKMTPRGLAMLESASRQCVGQTLLDFMFRHLQPYFTENIDQMVNEEPFNTLFEEQRLGRYKPTTPVLLNSNRYDPLVPHGPVVQLANDWCAQGADVEFRTNEEPPFLNKLVINHALPMLVDGEPAMQWIAARFNGEPTARNCGQF